MAVRNYDSTTFMEVRSKTLNGITRARLRRKYSIRSGDTAGRSIADVIVTSKGHGHLLVNDRGTVYRSDVEGRMVAM